MRQNIDRFQKGTFITSAAIMLIMILFLFLNFTVNGLDGLMSGINAKKAEYIGGFSERSEMYRAFLSPYQHATFYTFGLAVVGLLFSGQLVEKVYGIAGYIISGLIIFLVLNPVIFLMFAGDKVILGLTGFIATFSAMGIIAYIFTKESSLLTGPIGGLTTIIISFFVPGHEYVSFLQLILGLLLGGALGFVFIFLSRYYYDTKANMEYKQHLKEEEKQRKAQEKQREQAERIKQKHNK